jgi:hypothetical protein
MMYRNPASMLELSPVLRWSSFQIMIMDLSRMSALCSGIGCCSHHGHVVRGIYKLITCRVDPQDSPHDVNLPEYGGASLNPFFFIHALF